MASKRADREPDAEGQIELRHGDGRAIGAEPVEDGIAEGDIAGEAAEDVPGLGQRREQQRIDAELDQDVIAEPGNRGQRGGGESGECDRPMPHQAALSARAGRSTRTSTRRPKLIASV